MTKEVEVRIETDHDRYDRPSVRINEVVKINTEATLALNFLDKWGMVMGKEIGEDSSGRTKWGPADEDWIVDRAFAIARIAMARIYRDNLTVAMPTFDELDAAHEAAKAAKAAKKVPA